MSYLAAISRERGHLLRPPPLTASKRRTYCYYSTPASIRGIYILPFGTPARADQEASAPAAGLSVYLSSPSGRLPICPRPRARARSPAGGALGTGHPRRGERIEDPDEFLGRCFI